MVFEGLFQKDKLVRGTVTLPSGETIQGEWGWNQGLWSLKNGTMKGAEGEVLQALDGKKNMEYQAEGGLRSFCRHAKFGFVIRCDSFKSALNKSYRNVFFNSEGSLSYEVEEQGQWFRYSRICKSYLTYMQKEQLDGKKGNV